MKSFGLLRTNVALTTNIKITVDSKYKLSLDSIESDPNLSLDRFKKFSFNKDNYYDELLPLFFREIPSDIAYKVKYDNDSDTMSNDFANQYDELYNYGARNITNNKSYSEEFEYFAPLYFANNKLPDNFIIFRVDGSGIINLNKNNFRDEVLNNFKTVKLFNLKRDTTLGQWLDKSYVSNKFFPDSALDIDFRKLEFSRWNGIDYKNGGFAYKSLFIDDILDQENEIFELEKFVTESYRRNDVVFPNIINLSFLFDDTPATPNETRKWSLNRYYGFYVDSMELIQTISPYKPNELRSDVIIVDNLLISQLNENPFVEEWNDKSPFYIECDSIYYRVERYIETTPNKIVKLDNEKPILDNSKITKGRGGDEIVRRVGKQNTKSYIEGYGDLKVYKYRVISDIDLSGRSAYKVEFGETKADLNNNYATINEFNRLVINEDRYPLDISSADIWLIEIDGIYHNLVLDIDYIKLNTDYSFMFNENEFRYKVAGFEKKVDILLYGDSQPKKFSIFRLNLSDIKDFDTNIIDTEYSKYEYEMLDTLTNTDETKMYLESIDSSSNPPDLDDFKFKNDVVNIPVSSEYIVNYELFKVNEIDKIKSISDIWRKNPVHSRWAYQNSLSSNDVPYLLNNSFIFEDFNRTTNVFDEDPKRIERNLDYFYTTFDRSESGKYLHQSLHVQEDFNFTKYLDISKDYFSFFFSKKITFSNGTKNVDKFSYFNIGDDTITNSTLFRGIQFVIYDVNRLSVDNNNDIDKVSLSPTNRFKDYKLSILMSQSTSGLQWTIIEDWVSDKEYKDGDLILYNSVLYEFSPTSNTIGNNSNKVFSKRVTPENMYNWKVYNYTPRLQGINTSTTIFWTPNITYVNGSRVYYNDEFYYYNSNGVIDIWNPCKPTINLTYKIGDIVQYKNDTYISIINSNASNPEDENYWEIYKPNENDTFKWIKVQIWNPSVYYDNMPFIVNNGILYKSKNSKINIGEEPGVSKEWKLNYSLVPDTDFKYRYEANPIIHMNNSYYFCKNTKNTKSTLDNGIIIYINEVYKNILININISDNTFGDTISNIVRDEIYDKLFSKLTAANFIKAINDISNKYEFTDYVNYVIIDSSGESKRYDRNNISDLPYMIRCEEPEVLSVKIDSIIKKPINAPIKSNRSLENGIILNITQLNYYNKISMASLIIENKNPTPIFEITHGNTNKTTSTMYRYNGYYMPLFYNIQLFNRDEDVNNKKFGNYKFDTSLLSFGIAKERKVTKVNRRGSILKLDNYPDEKSIYPMLDEFGYSFYDFFIFSSTWDLNYYVENSINSNDIKSNMIRMNETIITKNIGLNR